MLDDLLLEVSELVNPGIASLGDMKPSTGYKPSPAVIWSIMIPTQLTVQSICIKALGARTTQCAVCIPCKDHIHAKQEILDFHKSHNIISSSVVSV